MGKDYYKTLGVEKNANQEEIKKAFRKLAHEHHPDKKGGNEAKFKEINEAYQVLGDAKKRSQYDQFGSSFEHAQAGGGFQGFDGFRDFSGFTNGFNVNADDLGDLFGGLGDMFGFSGGGHSQRSSNRNRRGKDIEAILTLDFLEAVFGTEKEISLSKTVKCQHCQGIGAEPGSKAENCSACRGSGRQMRSQRTIFGTIQTQIVCPDCSGEGKIFTHQCSHCQGSGLTKDSVKLKVKIPAGIDNGETIRLSGQGEAGAKNSASGDLYLKIRVLSDKNFVRDGYNILSKAEISFAQAALGAKIDLQSVDGEVSLKIPEGTQSGKVFILRAKGVPVLNQRGAFGGVKRGDHMVEIIVKTPTNLNKKQKELLKQLEE